ncbi:MAG: YeeE/YedE family protein [Sedimentisphaerales bacterium]|nr:YeeE/YedE family protein [Sedimentisphaerales bacterium]
MANFLTKDRYNPYIAGALAGVLAILSVVVSTKLLSKPQYLGASTTFVRAAGMIEERFTKNPLDVNEYYLKTKVKVDWQMMFVVGIFAGALISAVAGGTYSNELIPPIWQQRFGSNPFARAAGAFLGGAIALFGARLAGGCPSGHGLSGMMQLSISGLIAMVCFLVGGILTARIIYKGGI